MKQYKLKSDDSTLVVRGHEPIQSSKRLTEDEFNELIAQHPEIVPQFVSVEETPTAKELSKSKSKDS